MGGERTVGCSLSFPYELGSRRKRKWIGGRKLGRPWPQNGTQHHRREI